MSRRDRVIISSFELLKTRSDSLSLSSYSSWLLPGPLWGAGERSLIDPTEVPCRDERRLRRLGSTRRPVVIISSLVVADDVEEVEGCDETSIQESTYRLNEYMMHKENK